MDKITGTNDDIISSIYDFLIDEGKKMMRTKGNDTVSFVLKKFHKKHKINFEELEDRLNDAHLYRTYVEKINEEISF